MEIAHDREVDGSPLGTAEQVGDPARIQDSAVALGPGQDEQDRVARPPGRSQARRVADVVATVGDDVPGAAGFIEDRAAEVDEPVRVQGQGALGASRPRRQAGAATARRGVPGVSGSSSMAPWLRFCAIGSLVVG